MSDAGCPTERCDPANTAGRLRLTPVPVLQALPSLRVQRGVPVPQVSDNVNPSGYGSSGWAPSFMLP